MPIPASSEAEMSVCGFAEGEAALRERLNNRLRGARRRNDVEMVAPEEAAKTIYIRVLGCSGF